MHCRTTVLWKLAPIVLVWAAFAPAVAVGQFAPDPGNDAELGNIFPPVQREYRLALGRAEKAIGQEDYAAAVEELTLILNGEDENDYFLSRPGTTDAPTSLKTQALKLLGSMPPKGRSLYELKCGHEARNALNAALEKGDITALTEVARRYFHTQAGYEAAILLGRLNLDRGRPLAAALQFQRVAEIPSAAATYDPELSLLLATSWLHAHDKQQARQALLALKQRMPKARVRLGKDEVALFASDDDALPWLEKLVGAGGQDRLLAATEWIMFRGNEARNAASLGSLPLLNYRWSLPVVGDPADQQRVKNASKTRMDRNDSLVPAVQPLVVNRYAIFRTPDRVIGADLATGKRIWIFPWDDSSYEKVVRTSGTAGRSPAVNARDQELHQRLFDDHAFGQLSSDGEQVFLIDEIGLAPVGNQAINPNFLFRAGRVVPNQLWSRPFNKLVSLDIKGQGKLRWIIGGESGMDEPALAGAFFLGPPLPLEGRLYVLAEFNGEIRLLCLSGKSGSLEWKQTLAVMTEQLPVNGDPLRRLAGATPSFANGVLICPTSGGAVVAVDLATRALRWGYQYPRWDLTQAMRGFGGFPQRRTREVESESTITHWIDSSATIGEGCVLLTPPESDKLHCLDLLTGTPKWEPQPRGELFYVACCHGGKAILVGRNQVRAIELASGKSAWPAVVELGEDTPTGRGFYSDQYYYLPVTSSLLLKIDLNQGEVVGRVKTEVPLGNLVCYQEDLLSQSGEGLTAFYLTEPLRKRTDELLAKNPADPWALARKGEILLQDGQQREAVDLLRQAHQLTPEDEGTRSMLVRVMLALLKEDFEKHADLAEEARALVADQPAQARELSRLRALALDKAGKHWEAFRAYLEIEDASTTDGELLEEVARDHFVRRDRLIAGRLASLYAAADEPAKEQMSAEIQERREEVLHSGDPQAVREFVGRFGFHPLADRAVLTLARMLASSGQLLEAEVLVGRLSRSPEADIAGPACAVLATIYQTAGRVELAAARYAELGGRFADVVCLDEKTGRELAAAALTSAELGPTMKRSAWPDGLPNVKVSPTDKSSVGSPFNEGRFALPIGDYRGAAPRGIRATYSQRDQSIQVRSGLGAVIATTSLSRGNGGIYFGSPMQSNARLNGHLLVVGIAGEVVAINSLTAKTAGADSLLWRQEVIAPDPTGRRVFSSTQLRQPTNPLLGNTNRTINEYYGPVNLGMVTAQGVCFQRQRQLICAEPLTGKTVWERTLPDGNCEIFGDEEKLVVVPPGGKSGDALILSPIDGEVLDRRKIDLADFRWTTCGRNVLVFERRDSSVRLQLYDASNQGSGLWKREVKLGSKGTIIDGDELAILEPGGQFTIVSLKDGREILSQQPTDLTHLGDNNLESIVVFRSEDQYLLLANQRMTDIDRTIAATPLQNGGIPAHGQLLAFDRHSGAVQWPVAAYVAQQGLPIDQPPDSPVLFFVRRMITSRQGAQVTRDGTSVLAIDKRDGRELYADDSFLAGANHCEVLVEPLKNSVTLTVAASYTDRRSVTIELTDRPAPPQPPIQTGSRSSLTAGELAGEVDRATAEALQAMQREAQDPNRGRMILPARNFRLPALPPGIPLPR